MNKAELEESYIVGMVRQSDGKFFFSSPNKIYRYGEAVSEVQRRARHLSKDYKYLVIRLETICYTEARDNPINTIYMKRGQHD